MQAVKREAARHEIELVILPTAEAMQALRKRSARHPACHLLIFRGPKGARHVRC